MFFKFANSNLMSSIDSITTQFRLLASRYNGESLTRQQATLVTLTIGCVVNAVMRRQLAFAQLRNLMGCLAQFAKKEVLEGDGPRSDLDLIAGSSVQVNYTKASAYIISLHRICNIGDPIAKSPKTAIEMRSHFLEEVRVHNETWHELKLDVENDFVLG